MFNTHKLGHIFAPEIILIVLPQLPCRLLKSQSHNGGRRAAFLPTIIERDFVSEKERISSIVTGTHKTKIVASIFVKWGRFGKKGGNSVVASLSHQLRVFVRSLLQIHT